MKSFRDIFDLLGQHLRRSVLLSTVAASGGVALLPAILRVSTHGTARGLVIGSVCLYIVLGVYRLLSCFQTEKQLALEERFLRFSGERGRLLESAEEGASVWRQSVVVQAIHAARGAALTDREGPTRLRTHLRASIPLLLPVSFRRSVPALALVVACWILVALYPDTRLDILVILVLPVLVLLGLAEAVLLGRREKLRAELDRLMERLHAWASEEWPGATRPSDRGFQHRVVFRDPVRRG